MRPTFRAALLLTALLLTACRATSPTVSSAVVAAPAAPAAPAAAAPAPAVPEVTAIPETPAAAATPLSTTAPVPAPAAAQQAASSDPAPAVHAPIAYDRAELHGKLHLPPGRVLPDGVRVQLVLLDRFLEDAEHAVIARAEQPVTGPAPIGFVLGYDRALVADPTRYVLDVSVRDITGRLLYRSNAEHPVNLSPDAEPTRVELHAVGR